MSNLTSIADLWWLSIHNIVEMRFLSAANEIAHVIYTLISIYDAQLLCDGLCWSVSFAFAIDRFDRWCEFLNAHRTLCTVFYEWQTFWANQKGHTLSWVSHMHCRIFGLTEIIVPQVCDPFYFRILSFAKQTIHLGINTFNESPKKRSQYIFP